MLSLESPSNLQYIIKKICLNFVFPRSYRGLKFCENLTDFRCFVHIFRVFTQSPEKYVKIVNDSVVGLHLKIEECC